MTDRLFAADYDQPVDTRTLVDRIPGTADAPCLCGRDECAWPWCVPPTTEDTE